MSEELVRRAYEAGVVDGTDRERKRLYGMFSAVPDGKLYRIWIDAEGLHLTRVEDESE